METTFRQTDRGMEVWPNSRVKLPGYYQNLLQAERALAKYHGERNQAAKQRKQKKDKGDD